MAVYPGKVSQTLDEVSFKLHQAATQANSEPTNTQDQLTTLYHLTASAKSIHDITEAFELSAPTNALQEAVKALEQAAEDLEKKASL